jgi:hypothetical protein
MVFWMVRARRDGSLQDIIASQPTSKYDEIYYYYNVIKPDDFVPKDFVTNVYQSLTR